MNEEALIAATGLLLKLSQLDTQRPCSLARLAKQSARPMSELLRELSLLEALGLAQRDAQRATVRLSEAGRDFCAALAQP